MQEKDLKKLLNKMTTREKLCQCWQVMGKVLDESGVLTGGSDTTLTHEIDDIYRVGSTLNIFNYDKLIQIQKNHLEHDPNKIPMLFMADIIHGYATIFPKPIAYSCSFNPELVRKVYRAIGRESAAAGIHVSFFPAMDLSRDPRWGRVMESCGEDPYLSSEMCKAIVQGFQGDGLDKKDTIGACVKHFAGYGAAEGGRDYNTANIGERTLRQYYLPGYKGGVDAGAAMVMTSYNVVDGVPSNCNKHLIRDILKGEWGFKGAVITDLCASSNLGIHGIGLDDEANNLQYRGKISIEAGIDIDMGAKTFLELDELVEKGELDISIIDDACWRVLKLKNDLGLFENPYTMADKEEYHKIMRCEEHCNLAKEIALESCVLLKNQDNILPLDANKGKIAFIGPVLDDDTYYGSWVLYRDESAVSKLKDEIKRQYPHNDFIFAKGCTFLGREQVNESARFGHIDEENREKTISEAVEIAKTVDTVVLAIGEIAGLSGEARCRANIRIPDVQLELYRRVKAVNENVVVLLANGRPLDISEINDAKAILDIWSLGVKMTEAVTDIIFGKASPSGKLTMSFPSNVNQIPVYYNRLPTDHRQAPFWSEYLDDSSSAPLYPFGFGLTYSDIKYGETKLSKTRFGVEDTVIASIDITNAGKYDVTEIVQLYMRDCLASVSLPIKELKGFKRVDIKAGETKTVEFEIKEDMLRYYNIDMQYVSDAGKFGVIIAHDSGFKEQDYKYIHLEK